MLPLRRFQTALFEANVSVKLRNVINQQRVNLFSDADRRRNGGPFAGNDTDKRSMLENVRGQTVTWLEAGREIIKLSRQFINCD